MTDMKPITFTRKDDDGRDRSRIAYTPAEAVKLRFDGWIEQAGAANNAKSSAAAEKPAK